MSPVTAHVIPFVPKPEPTKPEKKKYKGFQWRKGVWYVRQTIDGHEIYESTGYSDITRARIKGKQIVDAWREKRDKLGIAGKAPLLKDHWDEYRDAHTAAKVCGHLDVLALTPFVAKYGHLRLNEFTKAICQKWINERRTATSALGKPYAVNTTRTEIGKIKAVFQAAIPDVLLWNPWKGTKLPTETTRMHTIKPAQIPTFLAALKSDEMRRLVLTLILTGLRNKEILGKPEQKLPGLRPCDVDGLNLVVRSEVAKRGKRRVICINAQVRQVIDQQRQARGLTWTSEAALWAIPARTVLWRMKQASKACGLSQTLTLHDLRRTYATVCARSMRTKPLMLQMGHSTPGILHKYYDASEAEAIAEDMANVNFDFFDSCQISETPAK